MRCPMTAVGGSTTDRLDALRPESQMLQGLHAASELLVSHDRVPDRERQYLARS
jgi:hypothetical protein